MLTMYDPEEELREYIRCEVAEGVAKGKAEGMAKGLAKGKAEGRTETMVKSVYTLMQKTNISMEKAMDMLDTTGKDAEKVTELLDCRSC